MSRKRRLTRTHQQAPHPVTPGKVRAAFGIALPVLGIIVLVTMVLAASLVSCASRWSPSLGQFAETGVCSDYVVLRGREPPFQIDVEEARPFSRWKVPWDDEDIVGLDMVWLKRPPGCSALPEFALVVNEYSMSKGLICLVDETGTVHASIRGLGLIQRIRVADLAPVPEPQLLVYTSPDHGPGARTGEAVLLAVAGAESRILLTTPRYEYFALEGDNYSFGMPILVGNRDAETRIAFLLFRFVLRERSSVASGSHVLRAEWDYSEYKWDRAQGVFRLVQPPAFQCFFSPDAWTWSPDYDVGGKGFVQSGPRVAPVGPRPVATR